MPRVQQKRAVQARRKMMFITSMSELLTGVQRY